MAPFEEQSLRDIAERLRREDPGLARALQEHHPVHPRRRHRRWPAWALLVLAVAALALGMALPHGLLVATSLVLVGIAANLFDPLPPKRRAR